MGEYNRPQLNFLKNLAGDVKVKLFYEAIGLGNIEKLKATAAELRIGEESLADTFRRIKSAGSTNDTPLHSAIYMGRLEICKFLVEEMKLDVNVVNDLGETPLFYAILLKKHEIMKYLLRMGANPNKADRESRFTPLHLAAKEANLDQMKWLFKKGANFEAVSVLGTPLHVAATSDDAAGAAFLLAREANANSVVDSLFTPLMIAILSESFCCVRPLLRLKVGTDPNCMAHGVTPLILAAAKGHRDTIVLLLEHGADANVTDLYGLTPAEIVAVKGHETCDLLLEKTKPLPHIKNCTAKEVEDYVNSEEFKKKREAKEKNRLEDSKAKGNASYHKRHFVDAIFWYTEALEAESKNLKVLSNRSLCWTILKFHRLAFSDAVKCIDTNPKWAKGFYRAGAAWQFKDYDEAEKYYKLADKFDPGNDLYKSKLREVSTPEEVLEVLNTLP